MVLLNTALEYSGKVLLGGFIIVSDRYIESRWAHEEFLNL